MHCAGHRFGEAFQFYSCSYMFVQFNFLHYRALTCEEKDFNEGNLKCQFFIFLIYKGNKMSEFSLLG